MSGKRYPEEFKIEAVKQVVDWPPESPDIPTVPAELFTKFQVSFYSDPVDAVYKALGVN